MPRSRTRPGLIGCAALVAAMGCAAEVPFVPFPPSPPTARSLVLLVRGPAGARLVALDLDPAPEALKVDLTTEEVGTGVLELEALAYAEPLERLSLVSGELEQDPEGVPLPAGASLFSTRLRGSAAEPWAPLAASDSAALTVRIRSNRGLGCPRFTVRSVLIPMGESTQYAIPTDDGATLVGGQYATFAIDGLTVTQVRRSPPEFQPTAATPSPVLHFGDAEGRLWSAVYSGGVLTATLAGVPATPGRILALAVGFDLPNIEAFTLSKDGVFARARTGTVSILGRYAKLDDAAAFGNVVRRRFGGAIVTLATEDAVYASSNGEPAVAERFEVPPMGITALAVLPDFRREFVGTTFGALMSLQGTVWRPALDETGIALPITALGEYGDPLGEGDRGFFMGVATGPVALWTERHGLCPIPERLEVSPRFVVRRGESWLFAGESLASGGTKVSILTLAR